MASRLAHGVTSRAMTLRAMSLLPLFALSACVTSPPVSSSIALDPASRPACERHCGALGMQMTAVVIYSSRVGCVCEVKGAPSASSTLSAAGVAAAGEVVNEEEAAAHSSQQHAQQQRQQQQQQHSSSHR